MAVVLAAGIPALIAALTFAVGEVIKARGRRDEWIARVVGEFAAALDRVSVHQARPWWVRAYPSLHVYLDPASSAVELVAAVRRRDRKVALWFLRSTNDLVESDRFDRVRAASQLSARLRLWQADPKLMRREAAEHAPSETEAQGLTGTRRTEG